MNNVLFAAAFLLGALAITWIGSGFLDGHTLALGVTAIIGGVYLIGCIEMLMFRRATASLAKALNSSTLNSATEPLINLDHWLMQVHSSLQSAVRSRIEGERVALPGPSLTPYLVGLLVMLGMLGTFVGMVVTLNGAVFALEGTTDLQAIRAGLAAPIKGLGLAFGTSVAGVAASAMLGLISTLSRRERTITAQLLDKKTTTALRGFSLAHHRQETFKALQKQAQALPDVVDKLAMMATQMERMGSHLNERLLANQDRFQTAAQTAFTELASSVERSLKASLAESGRLAGDSIKPLVAEAMASISKEANSTHVALINATNNQLDGFSDRFNQTAKEVADIWRQALSTHERASENLVTGLQHSLLAFNDRFEGATHSLLDSFAQATTALRANQASEDQARLERWNASLSSMVTTLSQAWQQAGEHTLAQQQKIFATLETLARDMTQENQSGARQLLTDMTQLLAASEALLQTRMAAEENWITATQNTHTQWVNAAQTQWEGVAERFNQTAIKVSDTWQQALTHQQQTNTALTDNLSHSLSAFNHGFEQSAQALLKSVHDTALSTQAQHATLDQQRLAAWANALETLGANLKAEWQQAGEQNLAQQKNLFTALETTAQTLTEQTQSNASRMFNEFAQLLTAAENLIQSRMTTEDAWITQHGERMNQLTQQLRIELSTLRDEEAARGKAAVDQLSTLQSALAAHLATLGTALEAPMTRLIETASEAPRAAAEVIAQLRAEISNTITRDNQMLAERTRIMEGLESLLGSLNQASTEQRTAIEALVNTSSELLNNVSQQFTEQVSGEAGKLADIAAQVTGSAVEVSSLSEAFGFAVQRFAETNEKLIENLHRIESSMEKSSARSDEQLAYYVAQAREIIDLSTLSQKEIFEELRQLKTRKTLEEAEVG